jgi:hypothetical protein
MILGIRGIEESSVYQGIFARGRAEGLVEEARKILLSLGRRKFGAPSEAVAAQLNEISDLDHLHGLTDRILDATSWDELLLTHSPSPRQDGESPVS